MNMICTPKASSSVPGTARRVLVAEEEEEEERRAIGWLRSAEVLHSVSSKAEEQITRGLCAPQVTAASQNKPRDQWFALPGAARQGQRCSGYSQAASEGVRGTPTPVTEALLPKQD